jgi:hypothetical protein
MELQSHFEDGKTGRNHVYENTNEKNGAEGISRGNSVEDSTVRIRLVVMGTGARMGTGSMALLLGTPITEALCEVNTRVMPVVYSVEMRTSGAQKLEG